jgi:hypothetical protein|nr:MAG TPA: minor tail protein [Caudoviricetes sp.]
MPQADGRIVIETSLESGGIKAGAREIAAACKNAAQTAAQMGGKAQVAIEKAANAVSRQNAAYAQQLRKVDALQKKLAQMEKEPVKSEKYAKATDEVERLTVALANARKERNELLDSGADPDAYPAVGAAARVEMIKKELVQAKALKAELESKGTAYVPQDTSVVTAQLQREEAKLAQMNAALGTSYAALGQKVAKYTGEAAQGEAQTHRFKKAMQGLSRGIGQGALRGLSSVGKKLKGLVSSLIKGRKSAGKMNSSFKGGIGTILKYGIGIRSLYVLFNKLRGAMKEGINNLAKQDSAMNASLSSLKSSLTQLKNSIAAAFSPVITAVVPILNTLIGKLVDATNAIGMFLAAISGQTTYKKATAAQEDYAASLEGTASAAKDVQQNLSGLDEINTWNNAKSGGGGSSGGFENAEISNEINDIAAMIRKGKWDELASALADKINGLVLSVDAKEVGGKIASVINSGAKIASSFLERASFDLIGDKIAATIVASVERIDWSRLGGLSVAGVNMLIDFVDGLTRRMSAIGKDGRTGWKKFADAVSDFVNSAIKSIKLSKFVKATSSLIKGLNDLISSAITKLDWRGFAGKIADAVGNIDISGIIGGATKVFSKLVVGLNGLLKGLLDGLDWFSLGEDVTHAIKQLLENIDWVQLLWDAAIIPIKTAWGILKGIAGGIAGIFTSSQEPVQYVTDELLDVQNQVEAVRRGSEDLHDYLSNLDLSVQPEKLGKLEHARDLVNEIFTLNDKQYKTNEEIEELKAKIELLNDLDLDGVRLEFNETSKSVTGTKEAVLGTIDALKKQYELEAKKEVLVDLYKKQWEAKQRLTEAEEAHTKAQEIADAKLDEWKQKEKETQALYEKRIALGEEYNEALKKNELGTRDWRGEMDALDYAYNKSIESQTKLKQEYKDTLPYLNETRDALKGATDDYNTLGTSIDNVAQSMTDTMRESGATAGRAWVEEFEKNSRQLGTVLKKVADGIYFDLTTSGGRISLKTRTISAYAEGGVPQSGQLFVANEAGPELVGNIGGRTAVANAAQIVEAVAKGVARAVRQALAESGISSFVREAARKLDSLTTSVIRLPRNSAEIGIPRIRMPLMASGSVIPPQAIYSARLAQKGGEQEADVIRRVIRDEVKSGGAVYQFVAQLNRRTIFQEMIDEAKLRQASSGMNPFLLGRA